MSESGSINPSIRDFNYFFNVSIESNTYIPLPLLRSIGFSNHKFSPLKCDFVIIGLL